MASLFEKLNFSAGAENAASKVDGIANVGLFVGDVDISDGDPTRDAGAMGSPRVLPLTVGAEQPQQSRLETECQLDRIHVTGPNGLPHFQFHHEEQSTDVTGNQISSDIACVNNLPNQNEDRTRPGTQPQAPTAIEPPPLTVPAVKQKSVLNTGDTSQPLLQTQVGLNHPVPSVGLPLPSDTLSNDSSKEGATSQPVSLSVLKSPISVKAPSKEKHNKDVFSLKSKPACVIDIDSIKENPSVVERGSVTLTAKPPVLKKMKLDSFTKLRKEKSPHEPMAPSIKRSKKHKNSSGDNAKTVKERTEHVHHEKVSKKTKPAKRERDSSGSTDAKAAYLPLSKPFVIPRKKAKQGLFQEVSLQSREFLKDILPIITKQYRSKDSSNRFTFSKALLIHNEELTKTFLERRKEMKEDGRTDKELMESYAFTATESKATAEKICQEGVYAPGGHIAPLGSSEMGVYLSRYPDIIKREGLISGHQGILIVLKILKGKVKSRPLNYTSSLDPMPNYDSHVAKANAVDLTRLTSLQTTMAYDASQIYIYEFGDLDMAKRPRQVCPYAMVHFTYHESTKANLAVPALSPALPAGPAGASTATATATAMSQDPTNHVAPLVHHNHPSMPTVALPASTPAKLDALKADTPTAPDTRDKSQATPSTSEIESFRKRSYTVWEGTLCAKKELLCSAKMVSFTSPVLPQILPAVIDFRTKMSFTKMRTYFPSGIFASGIPLTSNIREVCRRNKYVVYCELQQNQESAKRYKHLMQFLLQKQAVLKCRLEGSVTMFVLPTSSLSKDLGITSGDYPETLHVLFTSRYPMIGHITEKGVCVPHETKVQRPIPDNQLLEKSNNKCLMLRIGLLSMFTRQSHELKRLKQGQSPKPGTDELQPSPPKPQPALPAYSPSSHDPNTVIDYQHGLSSKKDLTTTYKSIKQEAALNRLSAQPSKSPLSKEVLNVHPMYSSPVSNLKLKAEAVPETPIHPMYNVSETSASAGAAASRVGTPSKQPHPMYSPLPQSQSPFVSKDVSHEQNVHPMYSQHVEANRGSQKSQISPVSSRDPRVAGSSLLSPNRNPSSTSPGIWREPPRVSRQSSKLPLYSILDQQQEINQLQEEMRDLRRVKETVASNPQLETMYNTKLTKLQDILSVLRQERNLLNQQQHGAGTGLTQAVEKENQYQGQEQDQDGGDGQSVPGLTAENERPVLETADVSSKDAENSTTKSIPFEDSSPSTETTNKLPGSSPALSTKVMEVVHKISKMPNTTSQSGPDVSMETLKEVIEKVLKNPSQERTEESVKSPSSFPVSIPLSMLSLNKLTSDSETREGDHEPIPLKADGADSQVLDSSLEKVSQADESKGGSKLPKLGLAKPPSNPFGDALSSVDQYKLQARPAKKLKRSNSKERVISPSTVPELHEVDTHESEDGQIVGDKDPSSETLDWKPLSFMERFRKENLAVDIDLAKKTLPLSLDGQKEVTSPIRGASEMKAFLNGKASHVKSRIVSATEMKSYLNKKLQEAEHEKLDRARKGAGPPSVKRGRGAASSRERTIAEIDNEIRRLNKEKERLKTQFARKRNSSGDKQLPFIQSVDLSGLGRIPKKKGPSPETVEGASTNSDPSETPTDNAVLGLVGSADINSHDASESGGLADGNPLAAPGVDSKFDAGEKLLRSAIATATLPDYPSDKMSYCVCPKELELGDGKEKEIFVTGQDSKGLPLYRVALAKKFLQGGMKTDEWSGTGLQHCVNDILHEGARSDEVAQTEKEKQFGQHASAATRKVLSKQRRQDSAMRQVTADIQQSVKYVSVLDEKMPILPESLPDAKETFSQEVCQDVSKKLSKPDACSNSNDSGLAAPERTIASLTEAIPNMSTPLHVSPIKASTIADGARVLEEPLKDVPESSSSQLAEASRSSLSDSAGAVEYTSTKLAETSARSSSHVVDTTGGSALPGQWKDLASSTLLPDERQASADKPTVKEGLVINDGACFLGDLESEEGVCVNFELDEDALTDEKSRAEFLPDLQPEPCDNVVSPENKADKVEPSTSGEDKLEMLDEAKDIDPSASKEESSTCNVISPDVVLAVESVLTLEETSGSDKQVKDTGNSLDSAADLESRKPVSPGDAPKVVSEISQCDSTTGSGNKSTSLKSDSRLKESRASHRLHPYERRTKKVQEEKPGKYSKNLAVPELRQLMQNYTVAAYKNRRRNRHVVDNKADFYDNPRRSPSRFKNLSREFTRGVAQKNKEAKQDVEKLAVKQEGKKAQLSELEKRLNAEDADVKLNDHAVEETFQVEKCYYEEEPQVEAGRPDTQSQEDSKSSSQTPSSSHHPPDRKGTSQTKTSDVRAGTIKAKAEVGIELATSPTDIPDSLTTNSNNGSSVCLSDSNGNSNSNVLFSSKSSSPGSSRISSSSSFYTSFSSSSDSNSALNSNIGNNSSINRSNSSSNSSSNNTFSSGANRIVGPGGGRSDSQCMGGGVNIQPGHITPTSNQDTATHQQSLGNLKLISDNRSFIPESLVSIINQHLFQVQPPHTSTKESCLLSSTINASRDPRIRRLQKPPPPPSSTQTDPVKSSQPAPNSSLTARRALLPSSQQNLESTSDVTSKHSLAAKQMPSKLPNLNERPSKSILKGSRRLSSPTQPENENESSTLTVQPCPETSSDASKKVKISLSQYKGKADGKTKMSVDGLQEGMPDLSDKVEQEPSDSSFRLTPGRASKRGHHLEEKLTDDLKSSIIKISEECVDISLDCAYNETLDEKALHPVNLTSSVQKTNNNDSGFRVDRTCFADHERMLPSNDTSSSTFLLSQPNLVVTIPRDDPEEQIPDNTTAIEDDSLHPNNNTDDVRLSPRLRSPEVHKMSLDTLITIALLELEDSVFNIAADAITSSASKQPHVGEHLTKLSPSSVSRQLQNVRYELDAFWAELRNLDVSDPLRVVEAAPCDPRKPPCEGRKEQNGEVNGNDLTRQTMSKVLADISSKLTACLRSNAKSKNMQERESVPYSKHLPKLAKLSSILVKPKENGNSVEKSPMKSGCVDEVISRLQQDFYRQVEDVCPIAAQDLRPKKKPEVSVEPEKCIPPSNDLMIRIQQMLTAARALSSQKHLIAEESKEINTSGDTHIEWKPAEPCSNHVDTRTSNVLQTPFADENKENVEYEVAEKSLESPKTFEVSPQTPDRPLETPERMPHSSESSLHGSDMSSQTLENPPQSPKIPFDTPERPPPIPEKPPQTPENPPQSPKKPLDTPERTPPIAEKPPQSPERPLKTETPEREPELQQSEDEKLGEPEYSPERKPKIELSEAMSTRLLKTETPEREPELKQSEDEKLGQLEYSLERKPKVEPSEAMSTPETKHATPSPQSVADSCKWGKFTMKLWGKRPTKQRKTMKATWVQTEKPKTSEQTSSETAASKQSCDASSIGISDGDKESTEAKPNETKEHELSSTEKQAVEDLCAKLRGEYRPLTKGKEKIAGTIPTLLNRTTSHASSAFKNLSGSHKQKSQTKQNVPAQVSPHPYEGSRLYMNVQQPAYPAQASNTVQQHQMPPYNGMYAQYNPNMYQQYPYIQTSQNNQGYMQQQVQSGPQPNLNYMQQYSNGYQYGSMGSYNSASNSLESGPTGLTNMGPGPTNMGPGPTNMGPGPTNMGPGPANMAPGPTNMGPGPTNMVPGPTNMVPGPTNMGPGPTNMAPGPANMGPWPTNMGPGTYNGPNNVAYGSYGTNLGLGVNNVGSGVYNMGSAPCNMGPGVPYRQQPPAPGTENEGRIYNFAASNASYATSPYTYYGTNSYIYYSQMHYANHLTCVYPSEGQIATSSDIPATLTPEFPDTAFFSLGTPKESPTCGTDQDDCRKMESIEDEELIESKNLSQGALKQVEIRESEILPKSNSSEMIGTEKAKSVTDREALIIGKHTASLPSPQKGLGSAMKSKVPISSSEDSDYSLGTGNIFEKCEQTLSQNIDEPAEGDMVRSKGSPGIFKSQACVPIASTGLLIKEAKVFDGADNIECVDALPSTSTESSCEDVNEYTIQSEKALVCIQEVCKTLECKDGTTEISTASVSKTSGTSDLSSEGCTENVSLKIDVECPWSRKGNFLESSELLGHCPHDVEGDFDTFLSGKEERTEQNKRRVSGLSESISLYRPCGVEKGVMSTFLNDKAKSVTDGEALIMGKLTASLPSPQKGLVVVMKSKLPTSSSEDSDCSLGTGYIFEKCEQTISQNLDEPAEGDVVRSKGSPGILKSQACVPIAFEEAKVFDGADNIECVDALPSTGTELSCEDVSEYNIQSEKALACIEDVCKTPECKDGTTEISTGPVSKTSGTSDLSSEGCTENVSVKTDVEGAWSRKKNVLGSSEVLSHNPHDVEGNFDTFLCGKEEMRTEQTKRKVSEPSESISLYRPCGVEKGLMSTFLNDGDNFEKQGRKEAHSSTCPIPKTPVSKDVSDSNSSDTKSQTDIWNCSIQSDVRIVLAKRRPDANKPCVERVVECTENPHQMSRVETDKVNVLCSANVRTMSKSVPKEALLPSQSAKGGGYQTSMSLGDSSNTGLEPAALPVPHPAAQSKSDDQTTSTASPVKQVVRFVASQELLNPLNRQYLLARSSKQHHSAKPKSSLDEPSCSQPSDKQTASFTPRVVRLFCLDNETAEMERQGPERYPYNSEIMTDRSPRAYMPLQRHVTCSFMESAKISPVRKPPAVYEGQKVGVEPNYTTNTPTRSAKNVSHQTNANDQSASGGGSLLYSKKPESSPLRSQVSTPKRTCVVHSDGSPAPASGRGSILYSKKPESSPFRSLVSTPKRTCEVHSDGSPAPASGGGTLLYCKKTESSPFRALVSTPKRTCVVHSDGSPAPASGGGSLLYSKKTESPPVRSQVSTPKRTCGVHSDGSPAPASGGGSLLYSKKLESSPFRAVVSTPKRTGIVHSDGSPYGCKVIPGHLLDDSSPPSKPDQEVSDQEGCRLSDCKDTSIFMGDTREDTSEDKQHSGEVTVDGSLSSSPLMRKSVNTSQQGLRLPSPVVCGRDLQTGPKLAPKSDTRPDPKADSDPRSDVKLNSKPTPTSADWPARSSPLKCPRIQPMPKSSPVHEAQENPVNAGYSKAQCLAGHLDSRKGGIQRRRPYRLSTDDSCADPIPSSRSQEPVDRPTEAHISQSNPRMTNPSGGMGDRTQMPELSVDRQDKTGPSKGPTVAAQTSLRGIVIPDEVLLLTCFPDELEALCAALLKRSSWEGCRFWRMLLRSEIVVKMDQVRQHAPENSILCHQAYVVLKILSRYRALGVIHLLPCQAMEKSSIQGQIDYIHRLRIAVPNTQHCHCVWLTDLALSASDVDLFKSRNIDVCNMKSLLARFTPDAPTHHRLHVEDDQGLECGTREAPGSKRQALPHVEHLFPASSASGIEPCNLKRE